MFTSSATPKKGLSPIDTIANSTHGERIYGVNTYADMSDRSFCIYMHDHFLKFGERECWGSRLPFGISRQDLMMHLAVWGQTGTGKSTLLRALAIQTILAGEALIVIEPHGDLIEAILDSIPPERTKDVCVFDPANLSHPIGFNPLANVEPDRRHLVISGLVGAFRSVWGSSWGPRLEFLLHNTLAALLECQNVSLLSAQRFLVDRYYRQRMLKQVTDPLIRQFWMGEFEQLDKRFQAEIVTPVTNKLGALLLSPAMRNTLGQVRNRIDARYLIDNKKIFLADLSKGRLGDHDSNLLGSLLVAQFATAAMSRADTSEQDRPSTVMIVDEAYSFCTDKFASILSESRKYKLSMVLAGQYFEQASDPVREAIFGNCGSQVFFRLSEGNARIAAAELGNDWQPQSISSLPNRHVLCKLITDGEYPEPFIGQTMLPEAAVCKHGAVIRKVSRERYGTPRANVEDRIRRWMKH